MRENRMDENVTIVYTAYITLRNGHRLYAKQYGKKAFELHPPCFYNTEDFYMNSKKTSSSVASQASRALRSSSTSKIQRQLAGSALSQAKSGHQTGKKMEGVASAALNSPKYSSTTKTLAGSVLSQSDKKR